LIDNADLNAIHILHSLAETDEFNALGILKYWHSIILYEANQEEEVQSYTFAIEEVFYWYIFGLKLGPKGIEEEKF
jgi:hypothetical protein